jgi:putative GTP pyrophosphokinase
VEYTVNTVIGAQTVLCEIQLRTLAMDFWASIEHTLNYKYHNELPQELRERLFNASQGVIALDSEMGKIRDEITGNNYYTNNKYKLMSTVDDHIQRLSDSGFEALSSQYTSDFNQIRQEDNSIQLYLLSKELEKELKEHNIYVEGDQNQ